MNVELRIEELLLHGFPPGDRRRIGDAVEHELSRLFAERGVPHPLVWGGDTPHLDAGAFEMQQDLRADAVGARVARSLYEGLTR